MPNIDEDITIINENLSIIQKKEGFRFSVDAIILADFFDGNGKNNKLLDIGCGNGIISVLLSQKYKNYSITGIDIQEENCILANKNIKYNCLDNITIVNEDIKKYTQGNFFDYVISNPPYMKIDGKKLNNNSNKSISRHEITLDLASLISNAKRVLKPVGSFYLVHRSYRFTEISRLLEDNGFSIKRVRFVHYSKDENSNLVLIQALKGKKSLLEIEPPLYLKESGY